MVNRARAPGVFAWYGQGMPLTNPSDLRRSSQAKAALAFPNAYGLTVRFAMKALPNAAVLQLFDALGLHIDASSGYEVRRAVAAGVAPERISLSSQELPTDLAELAKDVDGSAVRPAVISARPAVVRVQSSARAASSASLRERQAAMAAS